MSLLWTTAVQAPGEEEPVYYHASPAKLRIGTVLKPPGRWRGNFDQSTGEHVHMTPHLDRAEYYHYLLWQQGHKEPHIYEVQPHGPVEEDPEDHEAVRTKSPVTVTYHLCVHDEDED